MSKAICLMVERGAMGEDERGISLVGMHLTCTAKTQDVGACVNYVGVQVCLPDSIIAN